MPRAGASFESDPRIASIRGGRLANMGAPLGWLGPKDRWPIASPDAGAGKARAGKCGDESWRRNGARRPRLALLPPEAEHAEAPQQVGQHAHGAALVDHALVEDLGAHLAAEVL